MDELEIHIGYRMVRIHRRIDFCEREGKINDDFQDSDILMSFSKMGYMGKVQIGWEEVVKSSIVCVL